MLAYVRGAPVLIQRGYGFASYCACTARDTSPSIGVSCGIAGAQRGLLLRLADLLNEQRRDGRGP